MAVVVAGLALAGCNLPTPDYAIVKQPPPYRTNQNGQWIDNPDLKKVDEVGYADVIPGSGHGFSGWASLGPIAVYVSVATVPSS